MRWPLLALFVVLACTPERGTKRVGERCQSATECAGGYCVAGVRGESPVCTRSCAGTDECPQGWACSGVTDENVLVCSFGAPTPFGIGARE